jgi:RNA polymerase sigma-70 factor (ECF subfamily)
MTTHEEMLALVERAKAGDDEAWNSLYELYEVELRKRVKSKLGAELRNQVDASDVMQSVWVESIRSLKHFEYRGDGSFLAWVSAIVRHKIARKAGDARRKASGRGGASDWVADALPEDGPGPSTEIRNKDDLQRLHQAIAELRDADREILKLSWFDGLRQREIGDRLKISEDAARMRINRAETELERVFRRLEGSR